MVTSGTPAASARHPVIMGRLLGIISAETVPFDRCLLSTPTSLASLSEAHPEGWGAALYDDEKQDWTVEKRAMRASGGETFAAIAPRSRGTVLVAHLRPRNVFAASLVNTHPFRRGRWVFAHDGTIDDLDHVRAGISRGRLRECEGESDSELLFAHLLSRLDRADPTGRSTIATRDSVIHDAVTELLERRAGTVSFLLSDGDVLYAHRFGRSLHFLERRVNVHAVVIASEPLTDEPWLPLDDGTLLRCARRGRETPEIAVLRGWDPRKPSPSDIELPFTD
jgi:predicted glutamine amidotransferase